MTKKYNLSKIMKRAWELFRTTVKNFSECLKKSWAEAKEAVKVTTRYQLKDWFYKKLVEEKRSGSWIVYGTFGKEDVLKETEKAVYVSMGVYNAATGAESAWAKNAGFRNPALQSINFKKRKK